MNWKFHRGYGAIALGFGALALVVGACASDEVTGLSCNEPTGVGGASINCTSNGAGGSAGGGAFNGGNGGMGGGGGSGNVGLSKDNMGGKGGTESDPDGGIPSPPPDAEATTVPSACAVLDTSPKVLFVSADDSNSMGSPTFAREIIRLGFEPSSSRIRIHEFFNYYRINYAAPAPDLNMLDIIPEMATTEEPIVADFLFAVRSYKAPPKRRPMNYTFLVDTSGSMKGPGMDRAKEAVRAIASQLAPEDIVSVVTTDSKTPKLDGRSVTGANDAELLAAINTLTTGGTTDLLTGLSTAYDIAVSHRADNRMNRVIFISDGGVNVGTTDTKTIADRSADAQREGIYLVGIGTGPALTYSDSLMDAVTDAGRGAYIYLDSKAEAWRVLSDRFDEALDIAARSVQVKLTFPWYFQVAPVSTESSGTTKQEPQHLAPNDAMMFLLQMTACDAGYYSQTDTVNIQVTWKTRDTFASQSIEKDVKLNELFLQNSPTMAKARAIAAYADALKGCNLDKKGFSLCTSEEERRQVVKEKLILARTLAEKAKNGMPDEELDEILGIIAVHFLMTL